MKSKRASQTAALYNSGCSGTEIAAAGGGNLCAGRNTEDCEAHQASKPTIFLTDSW